MLSIILIAMALISSGFSLAVYVVTLRKIRAVHLMLNHRLTQLLEQTERAARLAGRLAEQQEQRERQQSTKL